MQAEKRGEVVGGKPFTPGLGQSVAGPQVYDGAESHTIHHGQALKQPGQGTQEASVSIIGRIFRGIFGS